MVKNSQFKLVCFIVIATCLLLGLIIQLTYANNLMQYNADVYQVIEQYRNPLLTKFFAVITVLGDKRVLLSMLIISFLWMLYIKEGLVAIHWLVMGIFVSASIFIIKELVDFPRPFSLFNQDSLPAFPSGHAALSIAILGLLTYLSTSVKQMKNGFIYGLFITLVVLIILSRLYLSSHWVTDVIGGILLGLICLMLSIFTHRFLIKDIRPLPGLLTISLTSLFIAWIAVVLLT